MPRQDPRLDDAVKNVNEDIHDRVISHMLFLERLKTQKANDLIKKLDEDVLPDVLDRIERRVEQGLSETGTVRAQELAAAIGTMAGRIKNESIASLQDDLRELAEDEVNWQVGAIREAIDVDIDMATPAPEMLRQIVSDRPFDGFTLQQWFDKLERSTQENLTGAVQRGIAQGETVNQIMQRVRGTRANGFTDGVLQTTRRQAETVTRSAVQHVSNQARTELFKQNDDVVKKVQWTATLDTRTCPVCMSLDGETFPVDGGKRPPVHANCRCAVTPVMKSWRELGVDRGEIPESTRASMNGQVPETKTFGTWLQDQPDEVVEDALGKKRARLFREGNLDVKEFVNRRDQTLTLKELRQREKSAFERAGVDVQ